MAIMRHNTGAIVAVGNIKQVFTTVGGIVKHEVYFLPYRRRVGHAFDLRLDIPFRRQLFTDFRQNIVQRLADFHRAYFRKVIFQTVIQRRRLIDLIITNLHQIGPGRLLQRIIA